MPASDSVVAVAGAGTMGCGIAWVLAAAGQSVRLFDHDASALQAVPERWEADLERALARGRMSEDEARGMRHRLHLSFDLEELAGAQLVVEAIVEALEPKQALLRQLEAQCTPETLLASNTSSLSITALGGVLQHPRRFLGLHFFNPAPRMKLVEVVTGLATTAPWVEAAQAWARHWGKTPLVTASTPGFIVNRVARPFYAEAWRLWEEGVAAPATLDTLIRGAGFPMGPFELMDLIGQDVNLAVTRSVYQGWQQDPRFRPSQRQQALVEAGRLGRKAGMGVYDYGHDAAPSPAEPREAIACPVQAPPRDLVLVTHAQSAKSGDAGLASLAAEAAAAGIHSRQESDEGPPHLILDGHIHLAPTRGCTATEIAARSGCMESVLFDLDPGSGGSLALAKADQASQAALDRSAGFFQALRRTAHEVDDTPGLVVMRSLALLVNEAVECRHLGTASAEAIDQAMVLGLGHPRGPLSWGDALDPALVLAVVEALHGYYADDRYRPSPLLRRRVWAERPLFQYCRQESAP